MPQFYPDGPAAVNLNAIQENGGINVPAEPAGEFDTPGMQGSMQQLLSENLGKFVMADFLIGVSSIVRRVGILYSVGRGFVVIYDENYHTFQVCDIFSLKFVTFYLPGRRPGQTGTGVNIPTVTVPGVGTVPAGEYGLGTGGSVSMNSTGSRTLGRG